MPRQPRSSDEVVIAKSIFDEIIDETESDNFAKSKFESTATARQKSGEKGGKARANKLTPKRRKEIAKKAAASRWKKSVS
jgi:hypothetical protein